MPNGLADITNGELIMSLSWVPDRKKGTAVTTVDYCYYTSGRSRKYYQHHDGLPAALEAADRFVMYCLNRKTNYLSHEVVHEPDKQRVMVYITEKLSEPATI